MHFHIITLFPESIAPYIESSILGRAIENKKIIVSYYNPRDFTDDKHARMDRRPYGGGPGMVLMAEPFLRAVDAARGRKKKVKILFFDASGDTFTNEMAREWTGRYKHIILICGHYEGIDARVQQALEALPISIGPYILTGGELPAAIIVDTVARQIEGVLGSADSREEERLSKSEVYTRPKTITYKKKQYTVPEVLRSGDHKKIDEWKKE